MPEDAGKKMAIREFLQQVSNGLGFIEDIWIDRIVKQPGTGGQYTTGRSLSGKSISHISELLKDDLERTFKDNFFTFRFIAAQPGSGKTTLLNYLRELVEIEPNYYNHSVITDFAFNELLSDASSQNFGVQLYSYILTQTFWNLLRSDNVLSQKIKNASEIFLKQIIKPNNYAQLIQSTASEIGFASQFSEYLSEVKVNFEKLFFSSINEISKSEYPFTFIYLIDELDALQAHEEYLQDARAIIRSLINRVFNQCQGKLRLMIYIVGRSEDVDTFIAADAALESRVSNSIISLVPFRSDECEAIKKKIDERIEGAYSGCSDYPQAWQEIQNITLEPGKDYRSLREFCKRYAGDVLAIHEKYFKSFDKPFNLYEDKARRLVEGKCREKWKTQLSNSAYTLFVAPTTTVIDYYTSNGTQRHAFDCYVELKHNGNCVARAFGEAKNYELLSNHFETFKQWLEDNQFKPCGSNNHPPELAFMIAPSCPDLLKRKLELKHIDFIESPKIVSPNVKPTPITPPPQTSVNINNADRDSIIKAFQGTFIQKSTIDRLINFRKQKPFTDLDDLAKRLNFTSNVKARLKAKLDNDEFCIELQN